MTSYEFTAMVKGQDLGFENALCAYIDTYGSFKQEDGSASDNLVAPAASMKHYLSADIMFLYYILRDSLTDAAIELLC